MIQDSTANAKRMRVNALNF